MLMHVCKDLFNSMAIQFTTSIGIDDGYFKPNHINDYLFKIPNLKEGNISKLADSVSFKIKVA